MPKRPTVDIKPMEVPQDEDAALRLCERLGYDEHVDVWRLEEDRILISANGEAITVLLEFDNEQETVRIKTLDGWPAG